MSGREVKVRTDTHLFPVDVSIVNSRLRDQALPEYSRASRSSLPAEVDTFNVKELREAMSRIRAEMQRIGTLAEQLSDTLAGINEHLRGSTDR